MPEGRSTVQRVTVISPRLNGAPLPPARARTITSPTSGLRTTRYSGRSGRACHARSISAPVAWARTDIQRRRAACSAAMGGLTSLEVSQHLAHAHPVPAGGTPALKIEDGRHHAHALLARHVQRSPAALAVGHADHGDCALALELVRHRDYF